MAQKLILLGTQGTQSGDTVRTAFDYCNQNFTELYSWVNQGVKTTSSPSFVNNTVSGYFKVYENVYYGGALFQAAGSQEESIEIIPIVETNSYPQYKLHFVGGQASQWRIAGNGIGVSGKSYIAEDLAYSASQSGQLFLSSANGNNRLMLGYDNTNKRGFIEAVQFGVTYSPIIINPYSSNVGIRTTSPLSDAFLDIGGSTKVNASIYPVLAVTRDANSIQAVQLQNTNAGASAEIRFIAAADDDTYCAFTQPSAANTGTFFGKTKSQGSFLFSNARHLMLGTISTKDVYIGTSNITRITISSGGTTTINNGLFQTASGVNIKTGGTFVASDNSTGIDYDVSFEDPMNGVIHSVSIRDGLIVSWVEE